MTKQMTPIKRYQSQIQQLRSHTAQFFRETGLNKVDPKYNRYSWRDGGPDYTKGVENDFVLIFSEVKKHLSFAFSFKYEGLEVAEQKVMASIKKGKDNSTMESSEWMTLDDFKSALINFNHELKSLPMAQLNPVGIIELFSENFLLKKLDLNKEIQKQQEQLNKIREDKSHELKIPELQKKSDNAQQKFEKTRDFIEEEIKNSSEFLEFEKLSLKLGELKKQIDAHRTQLQTQLKFKELKNDSETKNYRLKEAQSLLDFEINKELNKAPKMISKKLKK